MLQSENRDCVMKQRMSSSVTEVFQKAERGWGGDSLEEIQLPNGEKVKFLFL